MRVLLFIFFTLSITNAYSQMCRYIGTWISEDNVYLEIQDSSNEYCAGYPLQMYRNGIGKMGDYDQDFEVYLIGNTLRFQEQYQEYGPELITDIYDFKILRSNEAELVVRPVSDLSRSLFRYPRLKLERLDLTTYRDLEFEKLILTYSTPWLGGPDTFLRIEIDSSRAFSVLRETRIEKPLNYADTLSLDDYNSFVQILKSCHLDELTFDGVLCCDAYIISIDIYYNGTMKNLRSMWPPHIAKKLLRYSDYLISEYG